MAIFPRVTIVTPNFNGAATLEATIQSVVGQDYPNLEYIVVDGGSTDRSLDIIRRYERRLAHWESAPDRGQAHALNKGFSRSTGDIHAFLNSDDLYKPSAVKTAVQAWQLHPNADLIYGACEFVDRDSRKIGEHSGRISSLAECLDLHDVWWRRRQYVQPEVFWTADLARRIGSFNESLHIAFDYDYWIRAFALRAKSIRIPEVLAAHRRHEGQKTADAQRVHAELVAVARARLTRRDPILGHLAHATLLAKIELFEDIFPRLASMPGRMDRWEFLARQVLRKPRLLLASGLWQRTVASIIAAK